MQVLRVIVLGLMEKMKFKRNLGIMLTLLSLLPGLIGNLTPRIAIGEVYASPDMLPSSGDAWTENNNATYTWTVSPSYKDAIAFTMRDKVVGNYSLNVNHTQATTLIAFSLDLGSETDFSSFDFISFRMRIVRTGGWASNFYFDIGKTAPFAGERKRVILNSMRDGIWTKAVIPLDAFKASAGSPSWTDRRYIAFLVYGVTNGDNTRIYIDGMYFGNWPNITETATVDETMLPNFHSFIERWQKTQTYNSIDYTSSWSMVPVGGDSEGNKELESEALGQIIFAYSLANDYTGIQAYLDFAEPYVNWLLQFQWLTDSNDERYGGFWNQYTTQFLGGAGAINQGWILVGLSYYYHLTSNSTIKTAADKLARFMMDTLWDETNDWFDSKFALSDSTRTDATAWLGMPQGSCALGLSMYYRWVTQNSTVQTILDHHLNKGLSLTQRHNYYRGTGLFEDTVYAWWGYYMAYKAFSNTTYYDEALKTAKLIRANYEQNKNGSVWYSVNLIDTKGGFDGWGFASSLPLLYLLYEEEADNNYLELFENQLLDLTPTIETSNYSLTRKRASGDDWVNWYWTPTSAFIVASLAQYYSGIYKPNNPYPIMTDKEITTTSFSGKKLQFTVSNTNFAGATSITKVYCGNEGEPTAVYATNGTITWSYNASTKILTLNVEHLSPARIVVYWKFPGDIDSDGDVDADDFYIFAGAYGSALGDPAYNSDADIDGDDDVDSDDFYIFAGNYGKTA